MNNQHRIIEDIFGEDQEFPIHGAPQNVIRQHHISDPVSHRRDQALQAQLDMRESTAGQYQSQLQETHTPIQQVSRSIHVPKSEQSYNNSEPIRVRTTDIHCRDSYDHINGCDICRSYIEKDIKCYWFIIVILLIVIAILCRQFMK